LIVRTLHAAVDCVVVGEVELVEDVDELLDEEVPCMVVVVGSVEGGAVELEVTGTAEVEVSVGATAAGASPT